MTTTRTSPVCPFDHHAPMSSEQIFTDYATLRGTGVTYSDRHGGFWILSRYTHVRAALRDPDTFSSAGGIRIPAIGAGRSIPIEFDPPQHTDYRKLFTARITSQSVRAMAPFLTKLVNGLVDSYRKAGGGDFVHDVALPMPLAVLEEVVGFRPHTISRLRELTESSWQQITDHSLDEARSQLRAVIRTEIAHHRADRPADYLTELLDAHIENRPITDDELERALLTFAIAGHETTTNAAGWLAHFLANDPDLQATVRRDPARIPALVEEALRIGSPAQLFARETTREVEIDHQTIPARSRVLLALAAANRDDTQFPNAATVDLQRSLRGHLAFGFGIHQCPGAGLARTELKLLLTRLTEWPPLAPAGTPDFGALVGGIHHGPRSLPLAFNEGARQ